MHVSAAWSLHCGIRDPLCIMRHLPLGCADCSSGRQSLQLQPAGFTSLQHVWSSFPTQGLNPCPLPCKVDTEPLDHQASPNSFFCKNLIFILCWVIFDLQCCITFKYTVIQLYIYMHSLFFRFFSHIGHYRILYIVLCSRPLLIIYFVYRMCVLAC